MQDTELIELRETIEALKAKNDEAQAVIHGALNHPDNDQGGEINLVIPMTFLCHFEHLPNNEDCFSPCFP